jgi:hypothetical protein
MKSISRKGLGPLNGHLWRAGVKIVLARNLHLIIQKQEAMKAELPQPVSSAKDPSQTNERESDARKLVWRHMSDPNHIISEEEFRNIRTGFSPPFPRAYEAFFGESR